MGAYSRAITRTGSKGRGSKGMSGVTLASVLVDIGGGCFVAENAKYGTDESGTRAGSMCRTYKVDASLIPRRISSKPKQRIPFFHGITFDLAWLPQKSGDAKQIQEVYDSRLSGLAHIQSGQELDRLLCCAELCLGSAKRASVGQLRMLERKLKAVYKFTDFEVKMFKSAFPVSGGREDRKDPAIGNSHGTPGRENRVSLIATNPRFKRPPSAPRGRVPSEPTIAAKTALRRRQFFEPAKALSPSAPRDQLCDFTKTTENGLVDVEKLWREKFETVCEALFRLEPLPLGTWPDKAALETFDQVMVLTDEDPAIAEELVRNRLDAYNVAWAEMTASQGDYGGCSPSRGVRVSEV